MITFTVQISEYVGITKYKIENMTTNPKLCKQDMKKRRNKTKETNKQNFLIVKKIKTKKP